MTQPKPASPVGKHPGGRPPLPESKRRVTLPAQRVKPETKRLLEANARRFGGIGRVLDRLKESAGESL